MGDLIDTYVPSERGPPKKRRRIVVSCIECHRRKQKCDRGLPCSNCKARNKESHCSYEPGAPTARDVDLQNSSRTESDYSADKGSEEPLSSMAATWGYSQTGTSTIGFLKKIEAADVETGDHAKTGHFVQAHKQDSLVVREKYKGLIRQLPGKLYFDKLVPLFLDSWNWQYYFIDPDVFYKQLEEWNNLPFHILSSEGPQGLPPDLRVFPAVLFQIAATALLALPEDPDPVFESLKYVQNMTFEDLACDYSEAGVAIVNLFGKKDLAVTTVHAQYLRAHFLKLTANVTEAWHCIEVAIRDAQELGMHRDSLDPKPTSQDAEAVLENQWLIEMRRKMYMILVVWDVNTAVILGRPGGVDCKRGLPTPPVDTPLPSDRSKTAIVRRDEEKDPPTPLTRCLWLYRLTGMLQEIQDLEQEGPCPKDFSKIDRVHERILALNEEKPAIFRTENPDTRWDDYPGAHWIKDTRLFLAQLHEFNLMALHRPYIYHRQASRVETLRASLNMLELQRQTFESLSPDAWRNFLLFFGSFDAIVLIASIYILFPRELPEFREESLRHFHLTMERFAVMQKWNPLVRPAQGVLRAILGKLNRAIGISETPASRGTLETTPGTGSFGTTTTSTTAEGVITSETSRPSPSYPTAAPLGDWVFPGTDSLTGIAPMYPTSDLIYRDLAAIPDEALLAAAGTPAVGRATVEAGLETGLGESQGPGQDDVLAWQFGGGFGEDTFWQFLNQYQPGGD